MWHSLGMNLRGRDPSLNTLQQMCKARHKYMEQKSRVLGFLHRENSGLEEASRQPN